MKLRPIREGDTIALVSPSSSVKEGQANGLIQLLDGEGLQAEILPHAFDSDYYLAGKDEDRAADLMEAFSNEKYAAVVCMRGGYGCARLFPFLDLDRIVASRKAFFGFSDITTLHCALNRRGMPTVYSPMASTFSTEREEWVKESFRQVLKNDLNAPDEAPRGQTVVGGVAEGRLVGGCLTLLGDSLGTPHELDAEGGIVLIEDVGERPHRVDAILTHLLNSGIAQRAAGFVVGELTDTDEKMQLEGISSPWRMIVRERLEPLGKPMIFDYPFGHIKSPLTLPLGIKVRLDADAGILTYMEGLFE